MAVTATETLLHLRARAETECQRGRQRAAHLLAYVSHARRLLIDSYGARRVWLFGSLVVGQPTPESDVDLAVEGLPTSDYFKALADLMGLFHAPVDLVRLEEAAESLRERVLLEGREL
jgi:uncharacterized protein